MPKGYPKNPKKTAAKRAEAKVSKLGKSFKKKSITRTSGVSKVLKPKIVKSKTRKSPKKTPYDYFEEVTNVSSRAAKRKTTAGKPKKHRWSSALRKTNFNVGDIGLIPVTKDDPINPEHYLSLDGEMQVADVIERFGFDSNWHRAEAIRSLMRAGRKNISTTHEDLKKAIWYIEREMNINSTEKR